MLVLLQTFRAEAEVCTVFTTLHTTEIDLRGMGENCLPHCFCCIAESSLSQEVKGQAVKQRNI